MAVTRGMRVLRAAGVPFDVHEYTFATKGAAYAAEVLEIEPQRMAKTLVVELDGAFVFVLVPGDQELSLRELARAAGGKHAALAAERDAERVSGYQVGGISPFGSKRELPVYAVASWLAFERVALNAGGRGCIVELARDDVVRLLRPTPL